MKIRLSGTKTELEAIKRHLWRFYKSQIISISDFYPNRGLSNEGRIYIETTTKEFIGFDEKNFALDMEI